LLNNRGLMKISKLCLRRNQLR